MRLEDSPLYQTGFITASAHRRTLKISADVIEGIDECECAHCEIYFHLAPNWEVMIKGQNIECSHGSLRVQLSSNHDLWRAEDGLVSNAYGEKEKAFVVVLMAESKRTSWKISL